MYWSSALACCEGKSAAVRLNAAEADVDGQPMGQEVEHRPVCAVFCFSGERRRQ
jgi:hypothetical protein